ncbi:LysR family transcriptional regulator [Stappia sp. WLB 29]|uniref:LysR family transcriptional regulator n=1 Tax=Stappia sp. WLB 29 TaxID=2925220 RepID=UPI0020BFC585|nr:LysR family transcriptional regulator [Stappia sp. WLB 29]
MRSLNHRQMLAFRAVMISGSMTAAGRILNITQPAVTRLVRDLEADLGLTLFIRKWSSVRPTPEAVALFREVEKYFEAMERVRESAREMREKSEGRLRIAAMSTLSSGALPEAIRRYRQKGPDMDFFIHSDNSVHILDALQRSEFSIGLGRVPPERTDVDHIEMPVSTAICLLPKAHPLAQREVISVADLDGQPFISLGVSSLLRMQIEAEMEAAGVQPGRTAQTLYSNTVPSYVSAGLGISIADIFSVISVDLQKIAVRPFTPAIEFRFSAIFPATGRSRGGELFSLVFQDVVRDQVENVNRLFAR